MVLIYEGIFFGLQNQSVNTVLCLKFKEINFTANHYTIKSRNKIVANINVDLQ